MKYSTAFAAALGCALASAAHAQSSVQVYGIIDTSVEHLTNVNAAGDNLSRMPNLTGGMFPSRIGFRGTEDLGGGLKAIFALESGFAPDTGTLGQGNRLFGRQAWVGLSGDWGSVTVGRTYSMLFNSLFDVDIMGAAEFAIGSLDAYLPNARHDNSIAYRGTFHGVTLGATYSLGRDTSSAGGPGATGCAGENASDSRACRNWSALLRYDARQWGAEVAYDTYNGGPGAAAAFGPVRSDQSDSRLHVAAYGKFARVNVGGGIIRRNNEGNAVAPRSNLSYVGASYKATPLLSLDAQFARLDFRNSPNATDMLVLRAVYLLSPRTSVYAAVGRADNSGTAVFSLAAGGPVAAGGAQNGVLTGIKHSF